MGNEVAILGQPVVPVFGFNEVEKIATAIARGGLFGSKDPYAVLTLCMLAQAEGQHPAVVFRDYDLIQGKPAKKAEAMLRDFIHSGGKVVWNKLDDECADATFSHPQGGTVTINWTMARAAKAQLGGKDMWKKYPRQMLRSRTISEGVRTIYPGATSGLYVPEEVRDFSSDATPSDTPATPQPQRARDLKPEPPKAIEAKADPKRMKAEEWLAWLREEVDATGGEVEPARAIFTKAQPTLAKMQTEYPDLYAEAMLLMPEPEQPERSDEQSPQVNDATDEHPGKALADKLIAKINDLISVVDISTLMATSEIDIQSMLPEDGARVEVAADQRKAAIREQQAKAKEAEGAE